MCLNVHKHQVTDKGLAEAKVDRSHSKKLRAFSDPGMALAPNPTEAATSALVVIQR
jgi:hypothetical protein